MDKKISIILCTYNEALFIEETIDKIQNNLKNVEVIQKAISDKKCTGIRLYVENNNSIAQKVYTNLGMGETYYKLFEEDFNE